MATPRTRRLIKVAGSNNRMSTANRGRRRLQEEAILLNRGIKNAQARLVEINAEEEIYASVIDAEGDVIAAANADPEVPPP